MKFILVLLITTANGDITSARSEKALEGDRCQAIGAAKVADLELDNPFATFICMPTSKPAREPIIKQHQGKAGTV